MIVIKQQLIRKFYICYMTRVRLLALRKRVKRRRRKLRDTCRREEGPSPALIIAVVCGDAVMLWIALVRAGMGALIGVAEK